MEPQLWQKVTEEFTKTVDNHDVIRNGWYSIIFFDTSIVYKKI